MTICDEREWFIEGSEVVEVAVYGLSAPDIAPKTPKKGANEKPYIRGKRQERLVKVEFVHGRGKNQRSHELCVIMSLDRLHSRL